jgi:hypothetical protein
MKEYMVQWLKVFIASNIGENKPSLISLGMKHPG